MLLKRPARGLASPWRAGRSPACPGLAEDFAMNFEFFYLTAQLNHWLNLQVAHHLEAQAAKLKPANGPVLTRSPRAFGKLGADGPGGSVGLDCRGMPDGGESVEQAE